MHFVPKHLLDGGLEGRTRRPALRRRGAALLVGALWGLAALALPAPARAGNSLPVIDREGRELADSVVPSDLLTAVRGLPLEDVAAPGTPSALVLARVVLPPTERDRAYASSLVGRGWGGGLHFLSQEGGALASGPRDVVCIRLVDFTAPCKLVISKMGYKTVEAEVPFAQAPGKVVWMGDLSLGEPYAAETMASVGGRVLGVDGAPLLAPGEVTLRVNGTAAPRKVGLEGGAFAFPSVPPGRYVVELSIAHYAVEDWLVVVPAGPAAPIERTLTARPRLTLSVRVTTREGPPKEAEVECGLAYQSAYLDVLPKERLRIDQQGERVSLYNPHFKLAVASVAFTGLDSAAQSVPPAKRPWFSWSGPLRKGDLVILLTPKNRSAPDEDRFEPAQVAAVVEILDVRGAPAK